MRREPKQETVRHPVDPERKKGDGIKAAFAVKKDDKGKPSKPADPSKTKSDGIGKAQAMQGKKPSKLTNMAAAKKMVR